MDDKIKDLINNQNRLVESKGDRPLKDRLSVRRVIDLLFDEDSFIELNRFATGGQGTYKESGRQTDGLVSGYGTIYGKLVYFYGQDYRLSGSGLGEDQGRKIVALQDLALKMGAPIVNLLDSAGVRLEEGLRGFSYYGKIYNNMVKSSGLISQISLVYGESLGSNNYLGLLSDFSFMLEGASTSFHPPSTLDKNLDFEKMGDFYHKDQESSIAAARELIRILPSNNLEAGSFTNWEGDINQPNPEFNELFLAGNKDSHKIYDLIKGLDDESNFIEVKKGQGQLINGFISLGSRIVGLVANNPSLGGEIDSRGAGKSSRFINYCDAFNIPILLLVDSPGFARELDQARLLRKTSQLIYSLSQASVGKVSLVLSRAYGPSYLSLASKDLGIDQVLAWPSSEIGPMDPDLAGPIIYSEEVEGMEFDQAMAHGGEMYRKEYLDPYLGASLGHVDDIILPSDTRIRLIGTFDMLESKREVGPGKKHGNLPL